MSGGNETHSRQQVRTHELSDVGVLLFVRFLPARNGGYLLGLQILYIVRKGRLREFSWRGCALSACVTDTKRGPIGRYPPVAKEREASRPVKKW